MGYLGQYTHRVAITNHRLVSIDNEHVKFTLKDYRDHGQQKTTTLTGVEFLRRFCMHILPQGFVKIRYFGIYSSRFRSTLLKDRIIVRLSPKETVAERINRLLGFDISRCPRCKLGKLVPVGIIPRSRSPTITVPLVAWFYIFFVCRYRQTQYWIAVYQGNHPFVMKQRLKAQICIESAAIIIL